MSTPRAWHTVGASGRPDTTTSVAAAAAAAREAGHVVTPLVAAPPAGAPSYEELVSALSECVEALERGGFLFTTNAHRTGSSLLSRIPNDAGEQP